MLTDHQIAILCDIEQSIAFSDHKRGEVDHLVVEGYVRKDGDVYELTSRGLQVITDRGAGLNEA
jgi:hypothetical protein